jgi:hypothetical protein
MMVYIHLICCISKAKSIYENKSEISIILNIFFVPELKLDMCGYACKVIVDIVDAVTSC